MRTKTSSQHSNRARRLLRLTLASPVATFVVAAACQRPLDGAPCEWVGDHGYCAAGYLCCEDAHCRETCPPASEPLVCENSALYQSGEWCWVSPKPHGRRIMDIWGKSSDELWAIAEQGTVLRWNGASWSSPPHQAPQRLLQVWGASSDDFWIVTDSAPLHVLAGNLDWLPSNEAAGVQKVWGAAPDDVWGVLPDGMLHWDGSRWAAAPIPARDRSTLSAVWGTSTSDVWAVGFRILHWDGSAWADTLVDTALCDDSSLDWKQVLGRSPDDVWALAYDGSCAVHWDGTSWQRVRDVALRRLFEIHGTTDMGAFDRAGNFLQWNGAEWSLRATYADYSPLSVNAVWADSEELWAAGNSATLRRFENSAARWTDAKEFSTVTRETLTSVHGTSRTDVWSVGNHGTILHFDGEAWRKQSAPTAEDLTSVWARSPQDVWAVSASGTALHRSKAWSASKIVDAPLTGVWAASRDDVWAVGKAGTILHFDGKAWTARNHGELDLLGVWGSGSADVWVVGGGAGVVGDDAKPTEIAALYRWYDGAWTDYSRNFRQADVPKDRSNLWWTCRFYDAFAPPFGAVAITGTSASNIWVTTRCSGTLHWNGTSWERPIDEGRNDDMHGIWATADRAFSVGHWGSVNYWDGANDTWLNAALYPDAQPHLTSIWGATLSDIWAVGLDGIIMHNQSAQP